MFRGFSFWFAEQVSRDDTGSGFRCLGFDSSEGLLQPRLESEAKVFQKDDFRGDYELVTGNLRRWKADFNRISLYKGFFSDALFAELCGRETFPKASIVLIDVDLYESCVPVLTFLKDLNVPGTILPFDDRNQLGADDAADKRRAQLGPQRLRGGAQIACLRRPVHGRALAAQAQAQLATALRGVGLGEHRSRPPEQRRQGPVERPERPAVRVGEQELAPRGDRTLAALLRPHRPEHRAGGAAGGGRPVAAAAQLAEARHTQPVEQLALRGPARPRRVKRATDPDLGGARGGGQELRRGAGAQRPDQLGKRADGGAPGPDPRHPQRAVDAQKEPAGAVEPVEPRAHLAERLGCLDAPAAAVALGHRDPALSRCDRPVGMGDPRQGRQRHRGRSPSLRPGLWRSPGLRPAQPGFLWA